MKKIFLILFFINISLAVAQEVIDKIVAVVDSEVILQSELDFQVAMFAAQRNLDATGSKNKRAITK